jgi:SHS2 domain-containing protein
VTGDRGHRFAEHGGEVQVELEAATELGVFEAALDALAELVEHAGAGRPARRSIALENADHAVLLVDWLAELALLAELEEFAAERLVSAELSDDILRAEIAGREGPTRSQVKAVTLSGLELRRTGGTWHGRVVIDV